jgi:hypothetical protein
MRQYSCAIILIMTTGVSKRKTKKEEKEGRARKMILE